MNRSSLQGQEFRTIGTLYSVDGNRAAEVLEFRNGETFLDERVWIGGTTFKNRHSGQLVGPFASPDDAKKFIVAISWFRGS